MLDRLPRVLVAAACLTAAPLAAQNESPRPDCRGPEYRQFDFWLGAWEVTSQGGVAGHNVITAGQQGCLLREQWVSTRGGTGESLNFYDRSTRQWNQVWVDANGFVLRMSGGLVDGAMRLTGETAGPAGPVRHRLTFTPSPDGSVRQLWENSTDRGETWTVVFDGLYRRTGP